MARAGGIKNRIRILLVDDHELMRDGLRLLLSSHGDLEVVGEAENGRSAIQRAQDLKPDVVVMDVSMPELNGFKATERLNKLMPEIKILALTRHTDPAYLQQLLQAGAIGYLLKQSAATELVRAIKIVADGNTYLDPAVTGKIVETAIGKRTGKGDSREGDLTEREQEVLRLLAWGHANKDIAHRLQLSVKTVEAHKANAVRKMGMKSRIDIVRYALLKGWLQDN